MSVRVLTAGYDHGGLSLLAPLLRAWQGDSRFAAAFVSTPAVRREMSARVPSLGFPSWATGVTEEVCANADELDACRTGHWPSATGMSWSAPPVARACWRSG